MTEHPILFSGAMVRALLAGAKTMTRRVVKPQPRGEFGLWDTCEGGVQLWKPTFQHPRPEARICPFGVTGDLLWVRETWSNIASRRQRPREGKVWYRADGEDGAGDWTPSIHMPRWASRLTLRVTDVRVERLQDITEANAAAEGVDFIPDAPAALDHRTAYAGLWDKLNAKRGYAWATNPWVWVVGFTKESGNAAE